MATNVIKTSFAGGELSSQMYARVDLGKYNVGVELARNFHVDYRGGLMYRCGTKYIATAASAVDRAVRLIGFVFNQEQSYVLEFTNLQIRVFLDGAVVDTVVTPWDGDQIWGLKYVQSADVMTLTHPEFMPYDLSRTGLTTFSLAVQGFGPALLPPTTATCTASTAGNFRYGYVITSINANGDESLSTTPIHCLSAPLDPTNATPITIALEWSDVTGAQRYNIYKYGPVPTAQPVPTTFGYIGQTEAKEFTDTNIAPDLTRTPPIFNNPFEAGVITEIKVTAPGSGYGRYEQVTISGGGGTGAIAYALGNAAGELINIVLMNGGTGYTSTPTVTVTTGTGATFNVVIDSLDYYPSAVSYFQQRRVFGGSNNAPQLVEFSQIGNFENFDYSIALLDSDAISAVVSSREVNKIEHFVPMATGLIALTTGGAFLLSGGSPTAAITPTNTVAMPQAGTGAGSLIPIVVNYNVLFIQAKGSYVRDLTYSFDTQSYTGADRSMLANHLFDGHEMIDWGFAEVPHKLLMIVRDDGILNVMAYVPEQEVYGWTRFDTKGLFRSICVIPEGEINAAYVVVRRYVDGAWVNYIERFMCEEFDCVQDGWFLDSALGNELTAGETAITISGVEGEVTITGAGGDGFVMEALENYDETYAAIADAGNFPTANLTDTYYLGTGYDPVRRELCYAVIISRSNVSPLVNNSGFTLWDGSVSVVDGADFPDTLSSGPSGRQNWNYHTARKNIDTGVVTFYDAYDPDELVPTGIGGGDGSWRRFVADTEIFGEWWILNDPRTGNIFIHQESCRMYYFGREDNYTLTISPFLPLGNGNNAVLPAGLNDDWLYAIEVEDFGTPAGAYIFLIPREVTAAEITADEKLAYATYDLPAEWWSGDNPYFWYSAVDTVGDLYLLSNSGVGTGEFKLWKFTQPSAFVYPAAPVDGGVVEITPWTSTTGANLGSTGGDTANTTVNSDCRSILCWNENREQLQIISALPRARAIDDLDASITHTWYDVTTEEWGTTILAQGYMTADFEMTDDPEAAAYAVDGGIIPCNTYQQRDNYFESVLYASNWFWISVVALNLELSPPYLTNQQRWLLVKFTWTTGGAPVLSPIYDEDSTWGAAYPEYKTFLEGYLGAGDDHVIWGSSDGGTFFGAPSDSPVFDPEGNAFYMGMMGGSTSGGGEPFFQFDEAFAARQGRNFSVPPIMKLSFDDPIDCIVVGCAHIEITGTDEEGNLVGTIEGTLETPYPEWPDGTPIPIEAGAWQYTTPITSITLAHLVGQTVYVIADGTVLGPFVVPEGGVVELGGSYCQVTAGLQYQGQIRTLRLDVGDPTVQGKRKTIPAVTSRVAKTAGLKYGTDKDFTRMWPSKENPVVIGEPVTLLTGDERVNVDATWEREGYMTVQQDYPLPATVLGLIPEVNFGDNQK